jgi:hypothetical protein
LADSVSADRQREALLKLVEALGCWDRALRRDECGDWQVRGKYGHIYAIPGTLDRPKAEGFQIFYSEDPTYADAATFTVDASLSSKEQEAQIARQMKLRWAYVKKALDFCGVTNDGDGEGMLFLDRLPTPEEAEVIRDKLGIRKRVEYDEDTLARKREQALMARQSLPPKLPSATESGQREGNDTSAGNQTAS